jgi:hypothetical protein
MMARGCGQAPVAREQWNIERLSQRVQETSADIVVSIVRPKSVATLVSSHGRSFICVKGRKGL